MIALLKKKWRIWVVLVFLAGLLLALLVRLSLLQVFDVDRGVTFLQSQGDARTIRSETIAASRGMITDRNGQPLAVSTPVVSIWVNPRQLHSAAKELLQHPEKNQQFQHNLVRLAGLLQFSQKELKTKLDNYKDKQFIYLRRQLSPQEAEKILTLNIPGVYSRQESRRFYPAGEVTSQLLGFTNIESVGQEGLELAYDEWLQGHNGKNTVIKDLHGRTIKALATIEEAKPGKDLALSIDLRLQHLAYRTLKEAVVHHRADAGTAVMMDVATGEVLAMVNQPAFNPNNRSSITPASVRNRAMIDTFEPGSTAKPFTLLAALESGKYTPHTKVDTNPGYIRVNNKTLLDPVNYQVLDVTGVLVKSSQVGTTKIALTLQQEAVSETFSRVGFGQYSGVGFPGESAGMLPGRSRWSNIERANFAFGYGFTVTALQVAEAYSVFANGGIKHPISLLKKEAANDGKRIVEEKYARQISAMLEQVTGPKGTAKAANLELYSVAGKTGTAHKVGGGGYESGQYMAYFAGFAPAKDPRIVIVVVIDNPKGREYYGGEVAAPVFARIAADSLRILNVAPDKWPESNQIAKAGGGL